MPYVAEVRIELKPGVADPEGANTKKALELLGFSGVKSVKSVHAFSIELDAASKDAAAAQVNEMCKRLLVNPVVHAPRITLSANGAGKGRAPAKAAKAAKAAKRPAAKKTLGKKPAAKKVGAKKPAAAKKTAGKKPAAKKTAKRNRR